MTTTCLRASGEGGCVKSALTTSLELGGLGLLVAGAWLIFVPAAFLVAGAGCLAIAWQNR